MNRRLAAFSLLVSIPAFLGGCNVFHHRSQWESVDRLVARVSPTEGNKCHGVVWFTRAGKGVKIVADIEGLTPNAEHAFHIHQYGDATGGDGKSAGDHYNPLGHPHGRPTDAMRHAGDLGNLVAGADGRAHYERVDSEITLVELTNPIVGRAVVVHASQDKFTQPAGDAGARIGVGVIGIAKPENDAKPAAKPADHKDHEKK